MNTKVCNKGWDRIPAGVFCGEDAVPPGTFHGPDEVPPGTFHGCDEVPVGTFHGGDAVPPGTFHGGDAVPVGTFHGKDAVPPGTFHGGDTVPVGTFHGKDAVPPGTFHGSVYYRTRDGKADYGFSIERQASGAYRPYITNQPRYGGRAEDCHSTHRLTDGNRTYVCWTHELRTEAEAKQVAAMWADATQDYIRTGRRF